MKRRRLDLVCIYWRDAEADNEWGPDSDAEDTLEVPVFSVGWVLRKPTKENPTWFLAADIGEDALDPEDDKNRKIKIPMGMVDSVDRIGYFDGQVWHHMPEPLTKRGRRK